MQRITKETRFGPMTIRPYCDGYRVDFGGVKGWQLFDTHKDMAVFLADWSVGEISRLTKELEGAAKLQRYLNKTE